MDYDSMIDDIIIINKSKTTNNHQNFKLSNEPPPLPIRNRTKCDNTLCDMTDSGDYHNPKLSNDLFSKSLINIHNSSFLLSNNNELQEIFTKLLIESSIEQTSLLITQEDCRLFRLIQENSTNNGLILILLPHGRSVRNDLLER